MKRLVVIAPLLLILTGLMPAQVFLPHRFISASATGPSFCNSDCGCPPVISGLIQWMCASSIHTVTNGQNVTNWADISPALTNGLYATNVFGGSFLYPILSASNGYNHQPFVFVGSATQNSAMAQSNAWYSALTDCSQIWVIQYISNQSTSGWETMCSTNATNVDSYLYVSVNGRNVGSFGSTVAKTNSNAGLPLQLLGDTNPNGTNKPPVILETYTASNDWGVYTNGALLWSTNVNTVGWPISPNRALYFLSMPNGFQFRGAVYEILVYDHKLSTTDRASIVAWLRSASKYNF